MSWTLEHCNYSLAEGKVCPVFQWVPFIYLCKGKQSSKTELTLQIKPPNLETQKMIILEVAAVNDESQEKRKAKPDQRSWLSQDTGMGCFYPVIFQWRGSRIIRGCWHWEQFEFVAVVSLNCGIFSELTFPGAVEDRNAGVNIFPLWINHGWLNKTCCASLGLAAEAGRGSLG